MSRSARWLPLACAVAALALVTSAGAQTGDKQPVEPPRSTTTRPNDNDHAGQPDRPMSRERVRERMSRILADLRDDQKHLDDALAKFDAGASVEEVRHLLPDRLANRLRAGGDEGRPPNMEGPPGGDHMPGPPGGSPGSRRPGQPNRADQPFTSEDWEAVAVLIQHAQPEMTTKFDQLRQKDPAAAQRRMLQAYPRLPQLLDFYRHDRKAFDLRVEEIVIARDSLPPARKILDLRKSGSAADTPDMKAARAELRTLAKRQFENHLAIERGDLQRMRERMEKRQKDLDEQTSDPDKGIDRTLDQLIKQAERAEKDKDKPDGSPEGPDRPHRRPNE